MVTATVRREAIKRVGNLFRPIGSRIGEPKVARLLLIRCCRRSGSAGRSKVPRDGLLDPLGIGLGLARAVPPLQHAHRQLGLATCRCGNMASTDTQRRAKDSKSLIRHRERPYGVADDRTSPKARELTLHIRDDSHGRHAKLTII